VKWKKRETLKVVKREMEKAWNGKFVKRNPNTETRAIDSLNPKQRFTSKLAIDSRNPKYRHDQTSKPANDSRDNE
jgi:hypothetical protein